MSRPFATTLALTLGLSACAATVPPDVADRAPAPLIELPAMRVFPGGPADPPDRSNAEMARDFMELTFELESGRTLDVFTRFEEPITLRVLGQVPPTLEADLTALLRRFRREAGIAIARAPAGRPANITVETVPRAELLAVVPDAACFVVPRIADWDDFRADHRSPRIDWRSLERRRQLAIFLPVDVAPQEIRDCLHEELAQALGPLNDLFRLTDSVFNDDNFRTVLTGFDMLVLRATYAGELQSGMSRSEVAARLPAILARLNPSGARGAGPPRSATPAAWEEAIARALSPRGGDGRRRAAAIRAVEIARAQGWRDNRLAYAFFVLARQVMESDPELSLALHLEAAAIYGADPDTAIHEAHIAVQLAAFALSAGRPDAALAVTRANAPAARRAENAALLGTLLLIEAEALDDLGRDGAAASTRREGLGWARYGYGSDDEVRRRAAAIAAISPNDLSGGPS